MHSCLSAQQWLHSGPMSCAPGPGLVESPGTCHSCPRDAFCQPACLLRCLQGRPPVRAHAYLGVDVRRGAQHRLVQEALGSVCGSHADASRCVGSHCRGPERAQERLSGGFLHASRLPGATLAEAAPAVPQACDPGPRKRALVLPCSGRRASASAASSPLSIWALQAPPPPTHTPAKPMTSVC